MIFSGFQVRFQFVSSHNLVTFNRMLISPIGYIFILIQISYNGTELILITILYLLRNYLWQTYPYWILYSWQTYSYLGLILTAVGSYTYCRLILIQILYLFRFLVFYTELIHVRILISSLYLFRSPVGVTEPMLIQRS